MAEFANGALEHRATRAESKLAELAAAVQSEAPRVAQERGELAKYREEVPKLISDLAAFRITADEDKEKAAAALRAAESETSKWKQAAHHADERIKMLQSQLANCTEAERKLGNGAGGGRRQPPA